MILANNTIRIIKSKRLAKLKLEELAGRTGKVIEILTEKDRKNKGFMIQLDEPFYEEYTWFIPLDAVIKL